MKRKSASLAILVVGLWTIPAVCSEEVPQRLLFWQMADIREPRNVDFKAHSILSGESRLLVPADPARPSLWYNPSDVLAASGEVRLYYQRVEKTQEAYLDQRTWCVGYLRPGGEWVLPDLDLIPNNFGDPNNVVLQRSLKTPTWGGFNVFQTVGDATRGYHVLYWDQPENGEAGAMIASSTDGFHWVKDNTAEAVFTEHNDAYSLIERPEEGDYLLYQTRLLQWSDKPFEDNLPGMRRVISVRRSTDLREWEPQKDVLLPDSIDAPETEFYLLKVFRIAEKYAGLLMKYYGDPGNPGKHSALLRYELVLSEDGLKWERPHRAYDLEAWSYANPFEYEGNLCLLAYSKEGIALHTLRTDGLASCGSQEEGSFLSPLFVPSGKPWHLNADARGGSVGVEVVDENGQPIEGYGPDLCRIEDETSTEFPLAWEGKAWSDLSGRAVHLKFHINQARVYSVYED